MAAWNRFYDTVQAEKAQIVNHPSDGIVGRVGTQQLFQQVRHHSDSARAIEQQRPTDPTS